MKGYEDGEVSVRNILMGRLNANKNSRESLVHDHESSYHKDYAISDTADNRWQREEPESTVNRFKRKSVSPRYRGNQDTVEERLIEDVRKVPAEIMSDSLGGQTPVVAKVNRLSGYQEQY